MTYQIYCVRDGTLSLDGCWGSEHSQFDTREEAEAAIQDLHRLYPDVDWAMHSEDQVNKGETK